MVPGRRSARGSVNATPVIKTVDWLVHLDPPEEHPEDNRIAPIEQTTIAVEAKLMGFKREASDRDFHIVIGDKTVRCRSCARLRYSSEGGYLRPAHLGKCGQLGIWLRQFGNLPRPEPWLPYVFTSPEEAAEAGLCELSSVSWYGTR